MTQPNGTYVIRWREPGAPRQTFCVRGLNVNGRFYGTSGRDFGDGGVQGNISGQLAVQEMQEIVELIERIRARAEGPPPPNSEYFGVIADGPISYAANPRTGHKAIIYRASIESLQSASGKDFLRIAEILRNHIVIPPKAELDCAGG